MPTVLIVVAVVGQRDLPPQPSVAGRVVPRRVGLGVEDGLCEGQPLRFVGRRIGKFQLGGGHGRHAPEALVQRPCQQSRRGIDEYVLVREPVETGIPTWSSLPSDAVTLGGM